MPINFDCEYYERQEKERHIVRNTLSKIPPVVNHICKHPKNRSYSVTSKPCNIENDYCPYNPNLKQ